MSGGRANEDLRSKLDEVTERWGVKVTAVEIREVVPPREVQEAMNRQMSAERTRRAAVTEADGKRQATITVAEGEKQAQILRAEGERQGQILKAEGYAQALTGGSTSANGWSRSEERRLVPPIEPGEAERDRRPREAGRS